MGYSDEDLTDDGLTNQDFGEGYNYKRWDQILLQPRELTERSMFEHACFVKHLLTRSKPFTIKSGGKISPNWRVSLLKGETSDSQNPKRIYGIKLMLFSQLSAQIGSYRTGAFHLCLLAI